MRSSSNASEERYRKFFHTGNRIYIVWPRVCLHKAWTHAPKASPAQSNVEWLWRCGCNPTLRAWGETGVGKKSGLLGAVSGNKKQGRERSWLGGKRIQPRCCLWRPAAMQGQKLSVVECLQHLSGRPNLEASGWVSRLENAGPGQDRSRPD